MRGRNKENRKYFYAFETIEERRRRMEIQKKIEVMKRENEALEAKILFLANEHQKMVNLINACCDKATEKQVLENGQ